MAIGSGVKTAYLSVKQRLRDKSFRRFYPWSRAQHPVSSALYYGSPAKVNININFFSVHVYYTGSHFKVMHTPDAKASMGEAEEHCTLACARQLDALIKRFANRG